MAGMISAAVIAGIGTAYAIHSAERQKKKAKEQMQRQEAQQAVLEKDLSDRQKNEEAQSTATSARDSAVKKQRALASGSKNRSGTIFTSPLGLMGQGSSQGGGGKTLIGQ